MKRVAKFFLAAGLCVCLLIIPAYAVEAPSGENPANSVLDSMDNSIGSDSSSSASLSLIHIYCINTGLNSRSATERNC